MKSQILDEANHSADKKIAEAKAKAEKILKEAEAEAAAQAEIISNKAQADAENYKQRIESSCEMQRKQAILRAKQDVIAAVLDKAYNKILNLETGEYFDMIRRMLDKYVLPEEGMICFSAEDLKRMPAGFEAEIQKTAVSKGGALELSREAKEMEGGFVLVYGGIEENCTVKALFDAKRDELSDKVQGLLF
nr:V-type ATP synthase subunit E family protein [Faecalicatena contorta]